MTRHDPITSLRQMLDYAQRAQRIAGIRSAREIAADEVLSMAVPHALELVGESASRLSLQEQQRYPSIPWRLMVGMRNRLAHGYDTVNYKVVVDTIRDDIPPLIAALEAILHDVDDGA